MIIFSISTYNGLAKQEQNVEAKWSEVENKMQRQADLIPSVVSTVKAQMSHEEKNLHGLGRCAQGV
nr:LemA family protein [Lacticaseibacillus nasuensis]